ncbi:MAG: hypothetical protein WC379_10810 [Methanoregula sp.]
MKLRWIVGIIAMIAMIALVSADSTTNQIVLDPAQGMPGDTVVIPIKMLNAVNLGNADLSFSRTRTQGAGEVDCEKIYTITSVEKGSLTQGTLFDWKAWSDATVKISLASSQPISGTGTIAIVTVKVKDTAGMNGEKSCVFTIDGHKYDNNGNDLDLGPYGNTFCHANFTLAPALKGDGDHDGKVTTKDALTALQMTIGKIHKTMYYDMNGDGDINSNDVREILKLTVASGVVKNIGGSHLAETPVSVKEVETGGSVQTRKL